MATIEKVIYTDDLDKVKGKNTDIGSDGEHVTLSLDGMTVALDLTARHVASLRKTFRKYLDAGKVVAPNGQPPVKAKRR